MSFDGRTVFGVWQSQRLFGNRTGEKPNLFVGNHNGSSVMTASVQVMTVPIMTCLLRSNAVASSGSRQRMCAIKTLRSQAGLGIHHGEGGRVRWNDVRLNGDPIHQIFGRLNDVGVAGYA